MSDGVRDVYRYSSPITADELRNNPAAETLLHMKLFRAQRNFYIAGFALFLCLLVLVFTVLLLFWSGTDLILLLSLFCLLGLPFQKSHSRLRHFKSDRDEIWAGLFLDWQSHIFDLVSHFQTGGQDIISYRKCCSLVNKHIASAHTYAAARAKP